MTKKQKKFFCYHFYYKIFIFKFLLQQNFIKLQVTLPSSLRSLSQNMSEKIDFQ